MARRAVRIGLVVGALSVAALSTVAEAAPTLAVDPDRVAAGEATTASGRGFSAGIDVTLHLDTPSSPSIGGAKTETVGAFQTNAVVPSDTPPGRHVLIACGVTRTSSCGERAEADLTVTAAATTTTTSRRTTTSSSSTTLTTASTTSTTGGSIGVVTTTTSLGGPDGVTAGTGVGPDPTFDPDPTGLAVETTTTQPPLVAPDALGGPPDVAIDALEVTQGIQNLANEMSLVAGRFTSVRMHVSGDGADAFPVHGAVGAFRDGQFLGAVLAENAPIVAHADGGERVDIDDSLWFVLPPSWTESGALLLRGLVWTTDPELEDEEDPTDNWMDQPVQFFTADPLGLMLVPVHVHSGYTSGSPDVTFGWDDPGNLGDIVEILKGVYRYLPVASVDANLWPTNVVPTDHASGGEYDLDESSASEDGDAGEPHVDMVAMRDESSGFEDHRWYGMLDPSLTTKLWSAGADAAISWGGLASSGVSIGKMSTSTYTDSPWRLRGAYLIGHELGHNYGLGHANCKGNEEDGGGLDPDFPTPFPNCSMAEVDPAGYYGFDVYGLLTTATNGPTVISNDPDVAEPNQGWPLMGYEKPEWSDPYAWCNLLGGFGVPCLAYADLDGLGEPFDAGGGADGDGDGGEDASLGGGDMELVVAQSSQGPAVWVSASVSSRGIGSIGEVQVREGWAGPVAEVLPIVEPTPEQVADGIVAPTASAQGRPVLRLVDRGGATLAEVALDRTSSSDHDEIPPVWRFAGVIPQAYQDDTDQQTVAVELVIDGVVVDRVDASASPPVVASLTGPLAGSTLGPDSEVAWEASDPDGDPVTVDLLVSTDAGDSWTLARRGLAAEGSTTLGDLPLSPTDDAVLRVRASDGFLTSSDEVRGFVVEDAAPRVAFFLSPVNGSTVRPGSVLTVQAQAVDDADGVLRRFTLSSDRDGDLGEFVGSTTLRTLSDGPHLLTATFTDSGDTTVEASVQVTVAGVPLDWSEPTQLERISAILERGPADGDGSGPTSSLLLIGAFLAVGAGAVAVAARVSRRSRRSAPTPEL